MALTRHPLSGALPALLDVPIDRAVVARLRASFEVLERVATDAKAKGPEQEAGARFAHRFYTRLFQQWPGLRLMFPTDLAAQEQKLVDSLRMVVEHLEEPEATRARLKELGQRHAGYGAKPEHYPIVCALLVEVMASTAGKAWGPELSADWTTALRLLSDAMMEGAASAPPKAPSQREGVGGGQR